MKPSSDEHRGLGGLIRRRLINTTRYSWRGLMQGWKSEEALRVELISAAVLLPVALLVPVTPAERALLILVLALVLMAELLNSAVEAAVDRIGEEFHPLSGKAKDLGSAAVFISLILTLVVWIIILYPLVSAFISGSSD